MHILEHTAESPAAGIPGRDITEGREGSIYKSCLKIWNIPDKSSHYSLPKRAIKTKIRPEDRDTGMEKPAVASGRGCGIGVGIRGRGQPGISLKRTFRAWKTQREHAGRYGVYRARSCRAQQQRLPGTPGSGTRQKNGNQ